MESLDGKEIDSCLYELGADPLPLEHARILWNKLVESKGGVVGVRPEHILYAGHVLSGVKLGDVEGLNMGNLDFLFPFGKTPGLSKNVVSIIFIMEAIR